MSKAEHTKRCDPKFLDVTMYTILLNNLNPIVEGSERDLVLHAILKNARKHIVLKMHELILNAENK